MNAIKRIVFAVTVAATAVTAVPGLTRPALSEPADARPSGRWVCPMHPDVVRDGPGKCPKCGMNLKPEKTAEPPKQEEAPQLWTCGMHPQVIQDKPGSCPICGMKLTPMKAAGAAAKKGGDRKVRYWWDPMMSPPYISDRPGKSPMGMDLVPVYEDEVSAGAAVAIDPVVVQNMGVRVAAVAEGPLRTTVRAVGYLEEPEPNHFDINLRVSGWVEKLYANVDGMHVRKGDPLFDLYSPEMQVAAEEFIAARRARTTHGADPNSPAGKTANTLYQAAHRKLELLGLSHDQVERLASATRAPETVTFTSPIDAHITEKMVYAGAAVKAGDRVMRLADRSTMWINAQVFEKDLALIREGQKITATLVALPGRRIEGTVGFIHPHLDPVTRTAVARMVIPNEALLLRQGMYATVEIEVELAPRALLVPREAVIDTGRRQVAFVALDGGHFEPRLVRMGQSGLDGNVEILQGLAPGERVVTSGQFLLDAESRMQEAIQKHLSDRLLVKPGAPGAMRETTSEAGHGSQDH